MKNTQSYNECLEKMFALGRFGIKLGLDVISDILSKLNSPHDNFLSIHIAGTNGKGSIASTLSLILSEAGIKTGLYTSPHLISFNERICINNKPISDNEVVTAYNAVASACSGTRDATFFEIATAMAFYVFNKNSVEVAIIETGMGGRLDATNILKPVLSIISNVSIEHQTYLGDTIEKIAFEKGGIIKKNTPVITGITQIEALAVIEKNAKKHSADLYKFNNDFKIKKNKTEKSKTNNSVFSYFGINNTWHNLKTELPGQHQIDNAALVLASCELLNLIFPIYKLNNIKLTSIKAGLLKNKWPGRLEKISNSPFVIIDGAHNLVAAENLAKYLSEELSNYKITLVMGILDDKPYDAILKTLLQVSHKLIITKAKTGRSHTPFTLQQAAQKYIGNIEIVPDVAEAVNFAVANALSDEAICIAGSLYVVGEAKKAIEDGKVTL